MKAKTNFLCLFALLASAATGAVVGCTRGDAVKPNASDEYVASTHAIQSKTSAAAHGIIENKESPQVIAPLAGAIIQLNGKPTSADLAEIRKAIKAGEDEVAKLSAACTSLREENILTEAKLSLAISASEALQHEVDILRAEAEEARKNSVNWFFVATAALSAIGAAGFFALWRFFKDSDWLVFSLACAAVAALAPFVPAFVNSWPFKAGLWVVGVSVVGWFLYQLRAPLADVWKRIIGLSKKQPTEGASQ